MKWTTKNHKTGEIRIIKKFLFFPIGKNDENGNTEWHWLEKVIIRQEWIIFYDGNGTWKDSDILD